MKKILLALSLGCTVFSLSAQQLKTPAPSSTQIIKQELGLGTVELSYSRPNIKGRKIFGDLVPFGKVWRAGANEATTFVTSGDIVVGGKTVPAGSYTIFTVPGADKWTLIVNKKTGEWGIPYRYESDELGRVDMNVSKLAAPI